MSLKYYFLIVSLFLQGYESSLHEISDCASLLQEFATSSADFALCAISNARPILMCTSCIGAYNSVLEDHTNILQISESNNVSCKNRLINLDRLEIIEAGYNYVTNLWYKGRCKNCFESKGSYANQPSNDTLQFQQLYQDTDHCVNMHYNADNETYDSDVCFNCSSIYYKMNVFYDGMKRKYGDGQICMDIVDAMNITQNLWSGVLRCGEDSLTAEIPLIVACTCFLSLPFIFYIAAWRLSSATPTPVSRQKRLSTRFIQRFRSRTGSLISQFRH